MSDFCQVNKGSWVPPKFIKVGLTSKLTLEVTDTRAISSTPPSSVLRSQRAASLCKCAHREAAPQGRTPPLLLHTRGVSDKVALFRGSWVNAYSSVPFISKRSKLELKVVLHPSSRRWAWRARALTPRAPSKLDCVSFCGTGEESLSVQKK